MSDLRIISGDDETLSVTITEPNGTATNLTGLLAMKFMIKAKPTDLDINALVSKDLGTGVTVSAPATAGLATIAIDAANTAALAGAYHWEIQLTNSAGKKRTVADGRIRIQRDLVLA